MKLDDYSFLIVSIGIGFALIASIFLILMAICYDWRSPKHRKLSRLMPGPKLTPIFGLGLTAASLDTEDVMDYIDNLIKTHGSVVYMELLGLPNVVLNDPADIERVLNSSLHLKKGVEYNTLLAWLGRGLLTSFGEKWQKRRKMLTPTFHFKILETYLNAFNENSRLLTAKLAAAKDTVDIYQDVSLCALDVICETIMGTHLGSQMGLANDYVQAVRCAGEVVVARTLSFWVRIDFIFHNSPMGKKYKRAVDHLHRFTEQVIRERKQIYYSAIANAANDEDKYKYRKSFLDLLIEMQHGNPESMTDLDIREEVDTFMFEGHDTTSVAISWTLYMLGRNPEVQAKIREELFSIFGSDSERDCTMEDLHKMAHLERAIKESLRLYPSVPYIARFCDHELRLKNYVVPARTNISILPYLMHRNPEIFPDPEKFDPDRFLPDAVKQRHPFAYIPFSAGYRNCIGQKFALMEEKVILSSIIRNLKIHADQKENEIKILPQMILRPTPTLQLSFTKLT